jgi:hypothetical protein
MDVPPAAQRRSLALFAEDLGSAGSAFRLDAYGDWVIAGSHGHVCAVLGGFQFFVLRRTARSWTKAKLALNFAKLIYDGDDEGAFILARTPTPAEAEAIRRHCGIRKRPDRLAELRASSPS